MTATDLQFAASGFFLRGCLRGCLRAEMASQRAVVGIAGTFGTSTWAGAGAHLRAHTRAPARARGNVPADAAMPTSARRGAGSRIRVPADEPANAAPTPQTARLRARRGLSLTSLGKMKKGTPE